MHVTTYLGLLFYFIKIDYMYEMCVCAVVGPGWLVGRYVGACVHPFAPTYDLVGVGYLPTLLSINE